MIDMDLARRAHAWNSFDPDKRAEQDRADVAETVAALRAELEPIARSEAQRDILEAELARYQAGYVAHYHAYLSARSRTASAMVTGPARFPTARNQRALETERKRIEEMGDWDERARLAARRAVLVARTDDEVAEDGWDTLKRRIDRDMATVAAIDAGTSPYTRSAFVTSVVGQLQRLAANGETALVARSLAYIGERQATWAKPYLSARHGIWTIVEEAEATRAASPPTTGIETIVERDDLRAVRNHDLDRLQIVFAAKPDESTRRRLKASGWHWSPSEQAWQRKITNAAEHALMQFLVTA